MRGKPGLVQHTSLGKSNTEADKESRRANLDAEWKLDSTELQHTLPLLQATPTVGLFASRLNIQCQAYSLSRVDPEALSVDSFLLSW